MTELFTVPSPKAPSTCELVVRPSSDASIVLASWRELEARIRNQSLACSSDWTEAWLNAFGDLIPYRFAELRGAGNELLGLCLITEGVGQFDGPLKLRTLHVGTAGEPEQDSVCVEYNALLVAASDRPHFVAQLAAWLNRQRGIDQWTLDGIHADELPLWKNSTERLEARHEATHWFDLTVPRNAGQTVLDAFRSETRRKVRRSLEAFSNTRIEWAESLDHATDIFAELVELHQARWNAVGKPGSYSSTRFVKFHEELLARLVPQGRMMLCRVTCDAGTVGCVQLFKDHNRALLYQRGWAPADSKTSPGVVVDYLAMEECLTRGFDAYDFLAYETQHKRLLSNASCDLAWAYHRSTSWKFALLNAARGFKRVFSNRPVTTEGSSFND